MGPTHYEVLGIQPDASDAEVRQAYRARARATHPDQNPNSQDSLFVLIRRAYDVLSDPGERARYDAHLAEPTEASRAFGAPVPSTHEHQESAPAWSRPRPHQPEAPPPPAAPVQPEAAPQQVAVRRWPRTGVIAGGAGLAVLVAYALVPTTRQAFGSTLWVQLVGLAIAAWVAVRGVPFGAYAIAGLHLVFVVTTILIGTYHGHGDQTWMVTLQSLALVAFVFGAAQIRVRLPRGSGGGASASTGAPQYGTPGHTWKRLGCLGWVVALIVASTAGVIPAALVAEPVIRVADLHTGHATAVRFGAFTVSLVLSLWLASWAYRRITRRAAFWCQSCGVQTDPRFRICRACGRVKAAA